MKKIILVDFSRLDSEEWNQLESDIFANLEE